MGKKFTIQVVTQTTSGKIGKRLFSSADVAVQYILYSTNQVITMFIGGYEYALPDDEEYGNRPKGTNAEVSEFEKLMTHVQHCMDTHDAFYFPEK